MAGKLTELLVAGRLAMRSLARRMRSQVEAAPDLEEFTIRMQRLLAATPQDTLRDHSWMTLKAHQPPWLSTNVHLDPGDEVTYFIEGRVYASELLDIYVNLGQQLWCKVGEHGEIFRGTRSSHSFVAEHAGELRLGNYFPNDWVDAQGRRKQSDDVYKDVTGELRVLVIRWAGKAAEGLRALRAAGDSGGRVEAEIARMEQGDTTPDGWHYLWHLGPAEIYQAKLGERAEPCIRCQTRADVGILQKDVDLPLETTTQISWRWCVDQLPSTIREDAIPSHDYLSLAVEFDNGRDITYYWSSTLPVGTGYDCPLPNWKDREYHVVVRSGPEGLGRWQAECRDLYADYKHYLGEPPARITRVWLIANSIFQRGEGECDYSGIVLRGSAGDVVVL